MIALQDGQRARAEPGSSLVKPLLTCSIKHGTSARKLPVTPCSSGDPLGEESHRSSLQKLRGGKAEGGKGAEWSRRLLLTLAVLMKAPTEKNHAGNTVLNK